MMAQRSWDLVKNEIFFHMHVYWEHVSPKGIKLGLEGAPIKSHLEVLGFNTLSSKNEASLLLVGELHMQGDTDSMGTHWLLTVLQVGRWRCCMLPAFMTLDIC